MTTRRFLLVFFLMILFLSATGNDAQACFACWAGYGPGEERFNKPLADLRIIYEQKGSDALPYIRKALTTSTDPLVIKRAAGYIVDLNDRNSIPLLEDLLSSLLKRVAFSSFGLGTPDYQGRLAVAHALAKFGPSDMCDKIWKKYDKLGLNRKSEVPFILNALLDPRLTERLLKILCKEEDHQLMIGALDVLALGGGVEALPILSQKTRDWQNTDTKTTHSLKKGTPLLYYSALEIKARRAISAIETRSK
jgi:hypothetical protein